MHSKWEECVGNAVKVSLGVSLPTLSYWCWECPLKIENSLFFSLSLSRCILFSPCLSIGSVCLLLLSLMCCGSHLAGHDWLLWSTLQSCVTAFGVPGHYQTHPQVHGHTSSKNIFFFFFFLFNLVCKIFWFSHPLPLPFSIVPSHHPSFSTRQTLGCTASGFKTRRFDLHEVLAYASLLLRRSQCVCMCVKRMLMWVGVGPCNQTEDDNPGGHIVWASTLSSTDGRRDKETASFRQRQERAAIHFHTSLFNFVFDSHLTDPIATMKPAFVSIDSLTGSSSARGSLILSICYDWTEWENNECFLAFLWILYFF